MAERGRPRLFTGETQRINFMLPKAIHQALVVMAAESNVEPSELLTAAIADLAKGFEALRVFASLMDYTHKLEESLAEVLADNPQAQAAAKGALNVYGRQVVRGLVKAAGEQRNNDLRSNIAIARDNGFAGDWDMSLLQSLGNLG